MTEYQLWWKNEGEWECLGFFPTIQKARDFLGDPKSDILRITAVETMEIINPESGKVGVA